MDEEIVDDGYISNYLIHWAGANKRLSEKIEILSRIIGLCRLKLTLNPLHANIHDSMACFTDAPLRRSAELCAKYSNFGVAFHKMRLMHKGAQPVFYYTHISNDRDMGLIFDFLQQQQQKPTIDQYLLTAFLRHFHFMQAFSEKYAGSRDASYYDREWRIGAWTLVPKGENAGMVCLSKRLPPCCTGTLVREGNDMFFEFEPEDVAFLVIPRQRISDIKNPHNFKIRIFEELVNL